MEVKHCVHVKSTKPTISNNPKTLPENPKAVP